VPVRNPILFEVRQAFPPGALGVDFFEECLREIRLLPRFLLSRDDGDVTNVGLGARGCGGTGQNMRLRQTGQERAGAIDVKRTPP